MQLHRQRRTLSRREGTHMKRTVSYLAEDREEPHKTQGVRHNRIAIYERTPLAK